MEIRPPLVLRVYAAAFGAFWSGALGYVIASAEPTPFVVLPVAMLVVGLFMCWRMIVMSVIAAGEELIVRNPWRTVRRHRSQIEGFRSEAGSLRSPLSTVHALLTDGSMVALDAASMPGLPGRRRDRTERHLADLRAWLAG